MEIKNQKMKEAGMSYARQVMDPDAFKKNQTFAKSIQEALKTVLDPCCGSKMMWFNKNHPNVIYTDVRQENHTLCDGRSLEVNPDHIRDIRNLGFPDAWFWLVAMDLPHMVKLGKNSWMALKYGVLPEDWRGFIREAFAEAWRCLKVNGTLIFKWNEDQIRVKEVIEAIGMQPLFGHPTRHSKTIWLCFHKFPGSAGQANHVPQTRPRIGELSAD